MSRDVNQEAAFYLRNHEEYQSVMKKIKEKYEKTGNLSGKVYVENLSEKEGLLLGNIDYSLYIAREGNLSIKKFMAFVSSGKFQEIDFLQVLQLYMGKELVTRKTVRENKQKEKDLFFDTLAHGLEGEWTKSWLDTAMTTKKQGYTLLLKYYSASPRRLEKYISFLDDALKYLEAHPLGALPLPAFSSVITKNSHYFDQGNPGGKLLINALCYLSKIPLVKTAEETGGLLLSFGLLKDEISNQVMTYGLMVKDPHEVELPGYAWFRTQGEPLALTAYNLKSLENIEGTKGQVFVFENPAVFYDLVIRYQENPIKPTLICTSGQPTLSSLNLLDKMVERGTHIYYSGDFDPEGLQMADNLKQRYQEHLSFLEMTVDNYLKIKSQISISTRLVKLDRITSEELLPVSAALREQGKAGYQELLMDKYFIRIQHELDF